MSHFNFCVNQRTATTNWLGMEDRGHILYHLPPALWLSTGCDWGLHMSESQDSGVHHPAQKQKHSGHLLIDHEMKRSVHFDDRRHGVSDNL